MALAVANPSLTSNRCPKAMQTVITEVEEKRYAELQLIALDYARHGETEALMTMIRAGLPVNLEDLKGNSLLMLASYNGQLETTDALLRAGAEVDRRNQRQQTPLGGAAFKGYVPIVARLLESGADINADNGNGMTPLMFASMFGRTEVEQLLEKRGADSRARNRYGMKASWLARMAPLLKKLVGGKQQQPAAMPGN
jgi:ankyrin repeat protein